MPRYFPAFSNSLAAASLILVGVLAVGGAWAAWEVQKSGYITEQDRPVEQPIPFSHEHHVAGLGIDCRYCHTAVTDSAFAGLPATKTCITCHSQIWTNAPMLEQVRESWAESKPIRWKRVNNTPNYVYFNHSIHVNKGVGCVTCHGRVDTMPLMRAAESLQMSWCLSCHRAPERFLRPREEVFNMAYTPPADQPALGRELAQRYHIRSSDALINCYTCHR